MIEPKPFEEASRGQVLFKYFLVTLFLFATSTIFSADYFWVGNSGNWNDNSHWSFSSGGNGGAGIPTANDDVYFDANSFTVSSLVQINNNAVCRDINWEGTQGLQSISGNASLDIYGSLIVQDEIKNEYTGDIYLLAQSGNKTIKAGQFQWLSDFTINGGATFTFEDGLVTTKTNSLTIEQGTLITNGNLLYTGSFKTESNFQKNILLGTSTVRIFEEWDVETGSDISLNGSSCTLEILESIPQSKVKKGDFQYGTMTNKAACGNGIDFTVAITSNYNGAEISCNNSCDGQVTITINGGAGGPYGYQINNNIVQGSNVFTGLCAGTDNYTVYDSSQLIFGTVYESCTEFGIEISAPPSIGINVQGFIEPTCPLDCDGRIFTNVGGGTGVLTIEWPTISPFPFLGDDPSGACAGNHEVTVTDANLCTFTTDVTLTDLPSIVPTLVITPVSCNGVCDGEILASATGGNGSPYSYAWDGGITPADPLATGLCEDSTYVVIVTDALGCFVSASETMPDKDSITIEILSVLNPPCFGECTGEICLTISEGSGIYDPPVWAIGSLGSSSTPFAATGGGNCATNLCAGVLYKVYVTDDSGCTDSLQLPMLTDPSEVIISVTDNADILCAGDANGFYDITTVGGTTGYTYEWTVETPPGIGGGELMTSEDQFALDGGCYQVVATDFIGCTDTVVLCVTEPDSIFANGTITDNLCSGVFNGAIDQSVAGGMGPGTYSFSWTFNGAPIVDVTEDLVNLDSGSYTVTIVDPNLCSYDTTYLISTSAEIYVNGVPTNVNCNGASTGSIAISPVNGLAPYTFDWDHIPPGGYVDVEDPTLLPQGSYTVSILDGNGCVVDSTIEITEPTDLTGIINAQTNVLCNGDANGSVTVTGAGGTPGVLPNDYTYSLDGGATTQASGTFNGLSAGAIIVTIVDDNGCTEDVPVTITEPDALDGSITAQTNVLCNGGANGSVTVAGSDGTPGYLYSLDGGATTQASGTFNGLSAGALTVTVVDDNGCTEDVPVIITEPDALDGSITAQTNVLCNVAATGSVTVAGADGTPGYLYSLNGGGTTQPSGTFNGLSAGALTVTVVDDNGCTEDVPVTITEPDALDGSITAQTNVLCNGDANGSVTVAGADGTPGYLYSTNGGATTQASGTFSGLSAGALTVTVVDANGCIFDVPVTIAEPDALGGSITAQTNVLCNGDATGSVTVAADVGTGTPGYLYSLDGGATTQASGTFNGLSAGALTVTVVDANGCIFPVPVTITEPDALGGSVTAQTNVLCNDGATGSVTVAGSDGTPGYLYSLDGGATTQASGTFNGLSAGALTVTVVDDNGCTEDVPVIITEPDALDGSITAQTNVLCNVAATGSVTVAGADGTPGYLYSLNGGGTTQPSGTFNGLSAGDIIVTVVDANGCIFDVPVTITEPDALDGSITAQTNVFCNGDANGSVTVAGADGAPGYLYSTNGGATTQAAGTFSGLSAGALTVTVVDANGCIFDVPVTITEPDALDGSITAQTNVFCNGDATGSVTVAADVGTGTPGYLYSLDGGATTQASGTFNGLSAGALTVTVVDGNGCTEDVPVTITEPDALGGSITAQTNVLCNGGVNGSVTVAGADGTPGYLYSSDGGATTQASGTFNGLSAGALTVTVVDGNGCTEDVPVTITEPDALGGSITAQTNVLCNVAATGSVTVVGADGTPGYLYSLNGGGTTQPSGTFNGLSAGDIIVTVVDANGCIFDVPVTITEPDALDGSITAQTNVFCNGDANGSVTVAGADGAPGYLYSLNGGATTQAFGTFSGLSAGALTVTVVDANGCIFPVPVTITEPDALDGSITAQTNVFCNGDANGSVSVEGDVGTGTPPYLYSTDGGVTTQMSGTFSGLSAGGLTVTIVDANGCIFDVPVIITEPDALGGTITAQTAVDCNGNTTGSVTVAGANGTPGYLYSLDGGATTQVSGTFSGLSEGSYTVTIVDDNGCTEDVPVIIIEPDDIFANGTITNNLCWDQVNGSITQSVTGGSGPGTYSFSWTFSGSPIADITENLTNIDSGSYTVTIVDSELCTYDTTYLISTPAEIIVNGVPTNVNCNGASTGSIAISPVNGVIPYTFDWDHIPPGGYVDVQNPTFLPQGIYNVSIMDGNGCVVDSTIEITENLEITGITSSTNASCIAQDGSIAVVISGGAGGGTYSWTNTCGFPSPLGGFTVTGLAACCYDLTYTDAVGCVYTDQACVIDAVSSTGTFVTQDLTCFQSCDGSITSTIIGGSLPYDIVWTSTDPTFVDPGTANIFGLCSGDYTITVTDASLCVLTQTMTITEPDPIVAGNTIIPDIQCFGDTDGSIDITAGGGTVAGTYTFSWTGPGFTAVSQDISGLSAGQYCVNISDDRGCSTDTCIIISEPTSIAVTYTTNNSQCGSSDGDATIVPSGGTPFALPAPNDYTYNWYTIPPNNTITVGALGAGVYPVEVADANGCVDTVQVAISEDNSPTIVIDDSTMVSCFGFCNGDIFTTVTSATPFTLSWSGPGSFSSALDDISSLCPGTYTLSATDNLTGCQVLSSIEITEPANFDLPGVVIQPTCFDSLGSIDITPSGGMLPYTFDWDNDGTGDNDDTEDLEIGDGTYVVNGIDANGCLATETFTITAPTQLTSSMFSVSSSDCLTPDGEVSVVASGGTPMPTPNEYTYLWTSALTGAIVGNTAVVEDLIQGCYNVTITDGNGCLVNDVSCFSPVSEPPITFTQTNVNCFGAGDGTITITSITSGDSLFYTSGPTVIANNTINPTGLLPGQYTVEDTEDGCVSSSVIDILEPLANFVLSGVVTEPTCFDSLGLIDITPTGGTGPYTVFDWDNDGTGDNDDTEDLVMGDGDYTVIGLDANGCFATGTFTITHPTQVTSSTSSVSSSDCLTPDGEVSVLAGGGTPGLSPNEYTYLWTNASTGVAVGNTSSVPGLLQGCYNIDITDANDCPVADAECITSLSSPPITFTQTGVSCFGAGDGTITITSVTSGDSLFYTSGPTVIANNTITPTGLSPGQYTVQDTEDGCISSAVIDILGPLEITLAAVLSNPLCATAFTGAIDPTITDNLGVTSFAWTGPNGYFSTNEDITGLEEGQYCVTAIDGNGCQAAACYDLIDNSALTLTTSTVTASCAGDDGQALVIAAGGSPITPSPGYTYQWYDPLLNPLGTADTETGLVEGTYTVEVTDGNGCMEATVVDVSSESTPTIVVDGSTMVSCFGDCVGDINTTVTGLNSFTLSWSGPGAFSSALDDISSLCAGAYTLLATDDLTGCQDLSLVEITEPLAIFDLVGVVTQPTCFDSLGLIDITPSGGTLPYTFDWDNDGTGDNDDTEDLVIGEGTHILNGLDANGCIVTETFTIIVPSQGTSSTSSILSSDCLAPDGEVSVIAGGGTPGPSPNEYTYLWTNASTGAIVGNTDNVTDLIQGCYNVAVRDGNGCPVTDAACVTSLSSPPIIFTQTDVSCFGLGDGTITITSVTSGDSLFYTSGPTVIANNTITPSGLSPGQYTVEDSEDGCISSAVIDILGPLEITLAAVLSNPLCATAFTGAIDLTITNNLGATSFAWTGPNGYGSINQDITDLEAGQYCVTVTDGNGCQAQACYDLNDNPALILTTSSVSASCAGNDGSVTVVPIGGVLPYTIDWDFNGIGLDNATETGLDPLTTMVTVTDGLGCLGTASETVINPNAPTITLLTQSDVTCFGADDGSIVVNVSGGATPYASFLWSQSGSTTQVIANSGPIYDTLTVTDADGCIATYNDSILEPAILSVTGIDVSPECNGDGLGAIDVTVTGGIIGYTFAWTDPLPFSSSEDLAGLGGGTYDLLVTDNNLCTTTYSATLTEPTAIVLTPAVLNSLCVTANGAVSVAASGGAGPYTYDWEDVLIPGVSLGTNDTVLNLSNGCYQVLVTDFSGCQDSVTVCVSDINGPDVTSDVTPILCYGDANGAIDLTVTETGLTYAWTGPVSFVDPGTEDLANVEGGTYVSTVTNPSGCSTTQTIIVDGPTGPIASTAVITGLTCFDDGSGSIDLTTTGGSPSLISGYTYSWTGPGIFTSSSEDLSILSSGCYDLIVTDSNMCNYNTTYCVTQPDSIALNATSTDAACGFGDGSITTAVTGGSPSLISGYSYSWSNTSGPMLGNNSSDNALPADIYQIVVTDSLGCATTEIFTIQDSNGPVVDVADTDVTCNGLDNGSITLTTSSTDLTFDWTSVVLLFNSSSADISGLAPDTYNVVVTDIVSGCTTVASVEITEPSILEISGIETNVLCLGGMDGSIDITVVGGNPFVSAPEYTYSWTSTNSSFFPNPTLTEDLIALDTGIYTVVATDSDGCTMTEQYTIAQSVPMLLSSVVVIDSCFQEGTGEIDITVTQGSTPYVYSWTSLLPSFTPTGNEDIANLLAGTYSLTIVDGNGCQKDTSFIVTELPKIIADVTVTNANCLLSNGSAVSNASGGIAPYTYDWDGISTGADTTNVPSGTYNLGIISPSGCRLDTVITINDIGAAIITVDNITNVSCFGSADGSADVTITGTGPYTYSWNPNEISQLEDLTAAPADVYIYQVTDAVGCNSFETITVGSPTEVIGAYTVIDATCGICDGEATITASGGTAPYTYNWSDGQTTSTAVSLCPGVQSFQVTDFNNCAVNVNVGVSDIGGPTSYIMNEVDVTCNDGNDGSADVTASGGTLPYTYLWIHDGTETSLASNLEEGSYSVEITDSNGCVLIGEATITAATVIATTSSITPSTCGGSDGAIVTTTTGGTGAYSYIWSPSPGTGPDTTAVPEGIYTLTIDDGNCQVMEIFTIPGIGSPYVSLQIDEANCYGDNTGSISATVINNIGAVTYEWFNGTTSMGAAGTASTVNSLAPGTYTVEVFDQGTGCFAYATGVWSHLQRLFYLVLLR